MKTEDLKKNADNILSNLNLDNYMVRTSAHPHTKDVEALESCCDARATAGYYFLGKYYNLIDEETSIGILKELKKLQDTNENSPTYCCMRWYREEPRVVDTNGAFFGFKPIIMAMIFCPDNISEEEKGIICSMIDISYKWFYKICENASLYYPNKVMSDGAMLSALAYIKKTPDSIKAAEAFWGKWLDYTDNRGWGWGENTSATYSTIMLEALNIALSVIKNKNIFSRLLQKKSILLSYANYQGDFEFAPTIRTYNMSGSDKNFQPIYICGKCSWDDCEMTTNLMLFMVLESLAPKCEIVKYDSKSMHKEKIFDNSYAFTWKGNKIKLGTVSLFPVMPGSYQHGTGWGLGWQSMPVNAVIEGKQTSFLRYVTINNNKMRSHIAVSKHEAYLSTHLFEDDNVPRFAVNCDQKENIAIVSKVMDNLANTAQYIADEWTVNNFKGELKTYNDWYIIKQGEQIIALKPLMGINHLEEYGYLKTKIINENDTLRICQIIYEGENKLVVSSRVETAWIITAWDSNEELEGKLDNINIKDEFYGLETIPQDIHLICADDCKLEI